MVRLEDPELRKAYNKLMADYYREKYQNDPVWREKRLGYNKKWRQANKDKWNEIQRRYRNSKVENGNKS